MLRSQGSDTRQSIKPGRSTLLGLQGANLSFLKIHFFNVHMCVCVNLCAPHACRCPGRPEGVGFPGTRITGLCEPSDIDTRNQTRVLCKSSKCS